MKRVRDEVYVEAQTGGQTNGSRPLTIGGNMGGLTTDDALNYLKSVKDMFQDNNEKYNSFLALMKDFKSQRVDTNGVIARVKELFNGYDDLLLGFSSFLPRGYRVTLPEKKPVAFDEAIGFVNKIKARFGDDQRAYKRFLDILNLYRKDGKSISSVYEEVTLLFQGHEDLLAEFVNFLPNTLGSGSAQCPLSGSNAVPAMNPMHFDKRIKIGSRPHEYIDQREDGDENLVGAGNSRGKSLNQVQWPGYNDGIQDHENVVYGYGSRKDNMVKGINELDLSDCVQCTPSYRHLPDDYPIHVSSYRNSLGRKVLNDHWVSVTSGSEDYSFKHMRKNQYEESLFRCEDDRYELDMLLESAKAAIRGVEALLEKVNNNTISTPICIEQHLTVMNLRCIERLYGDYGLNVMDILNTNLHVALPVILTRLKQKQEEWARCHFDFSKVWADVYAKNHHKSLDHRSFYFKQQDSKNLSTKGLVAEIKDIVDKRHREDPFHAIAVGTKRSFTPDLEFRYSDTQLHADLYQLIKYYCEEICATEQSDKVMKLWVTFLEPMFGIPSRTQSCEAMIDVAKSKDNQEQHDACEAVKDNTCDVSLVSNLKLPTPPTSPNKENPTVQGSSVAQNLPISAQETIQQDIEDAQPPKLVSPPRKDSLMEGVVNRIKVSDVTMGDQKVEREEGELSPTASFEQDNYEVYRDNGVESVQKLPDNVGSNKEQEHKEGAVCTEAGAKSSTLPKDDEHKITQKLSEADGKASKDIASGSKFGGQVSSQEEHKGAMIESENEAVEMTNSNESGDGSFLTFSERYLQAVKPLAKHVPATLQVTESNSPNDSRVFYGNDSFYVLFRLHRKLYERIQSAKIHPERKREATDPENTSPDPYARFMDALYNVLDGSIDNTKFEDECRALVGTQSYLLFTLDKLVQKFVKHLHAVAADETDTKLLQLYAYEHCRKPGRFFDTVYHENTRALLHEQNIYRIEYSSSQTRLAIQLMNDGNDHQPEATAVAVEPGFANYLQNDFLSVVADEERPGLFLKRNKAKMSGVDESSGMLRAMKGLKIINEVECKMSCSSSKVKYEPNTSDFLYRRKQKKPNGIDNDKTREVLRKKKLRFEMCLNQRLAALP